MTGKYTLILIIVVLSLFEQTHSMSNEEQTYLAQNRETEVAYAITRLTLLINKELGITGNVVFAPINIAEALSLALLGSHGKTFQELTLFFQPVRGVPKKRILTFHLILGGKILDIITDPAFDLEGQMSIEAAIFVQNNFPIRSEYREAAQNIYYSQIVNVDFRNDPFETQRLINDWVYKRTNGKIERILSDPPSPSTNMVIASVMYFKARWEYPFQEGATMRLPFYPNGKKSSTDIEVDMMTNMGTFPYLRDDVLGCEVLGLPYKGNSIVMYIVKPLNSNVQKLREFENRLKPWHLEYFTVNTTLTDVGVFFPKMKLESTIDLKQILMKLGVKSLFDPFESNLELLSPAGSSGLSVDEVIHKVYMDITESGTEAAAATIMGSLRISPSVTFQANVPFIYFIWHEQTKTILFWGSVYNPTSN